MFDLNIDLKTNKSRIEFTLEPQQACTCINYINYIMQALSLEPLKYKNFPNISNDILKRLEAIGIENTLQLYEEVLTPECRQYFSAKTGINEKDVLKLTKYADLSRLGFLSQPVIFALVETGFDTTEKISQSEPKKMYHAINYFNKESNGHTSNISLEEIHLVMGIAKYLNKEVEY